MLLRLGGGAKAKVVAAGLGREGNSGKDGKEKANSDLLMPTAPVAEVHRVTAAALGTATSPAAAAIRGIRSGPSGCCWCTRRRPWCRPRGSAC